MRGCAKHPLLRSWNNLPGMVSMETTLQSKVLPANTGTENDTFCNTGVFGQSPRARPALRCRVSARGCHRTLVAPTSKRASWWRKTGDNRRVNRCCGAPWRSAGPPHRRTGRCWSPQSCLRWAARAAPPRSRPSPAQARCNRTRRGLGPGTGGVTTPDRCAPAGCIGSPHVAAVGSPLGKGVQCSWVQDL